MELTPSNCMFCRAPTRNEPEEHIVAASLVGDITFDTESRSGLVVPRRKLVLCDDEVCGRCNNGELSSLDKYLQDQLGFLKVLWNSTGTKKGRPAAMVRPGARAEHTRTGIHIVLNSEPHPITTEGGRVVQPAGKREGAVRVKTFKVTGESVQATFTQPTRINKRFIRALHKIAFELLCFQKGLGYVLDTRFDWLRGYILNGVGNRAIGMVRSAGPHPVPPPFRLTLEQIPGTEDWIVKICLGVEYVLDLTPDNRVVLCADAEVLRSGELLRWGDGNGGHVF